MLLVVPVIFAHCEKKFMSRVDDFFKEAGLIVHHKRLCGVVYNHIFCQIKVLAVVLVLAWAVLAGEKEEVVVQEDHAHYFDERVAFETHL